MDLQKLSAVLKSLPQSNLEAKSTRTLLEIAGYPHREIVASNILKFFFDSRAEHGLKTLFLESILETAGIPYTSTDLSLISDPKREDHTDDDTYLDLVIETFTMVLGIENKLFYEANNDFIGYENHLRKHAGERKVFCILLSLFQNEPGLHLGNFIPVTYTGFIKNIYKNLERFEPESDPHYLHLLYDFMETLKNLRKEGNTVDKQIRIWLNENQDQLNPLLRNIDLLKRQFQNKIKELQPLIEIEKYNPSKVKINFHTYKPKEFLMSMVLVYGFSIPDGLDFEICVALHPTQWIIDVWRDEGSSLAFIMEFFRQLGIGTCRPDSEYSFTIEPVYDFDTAPSIIAHRMQSIIEAIVTAVKPMRRR